MRFWLALLLIFVVYSVGYAWKDRRKLKLKSTIEKQGKSYTAKDRQQSLLANVTSTKALKDSSKSIRKDKLSGYSKKDEKVDRVNSKRSKSGFNVNLKKSKLKSHIATKKSSSTSGKRQNVLTDDPSQQRLFHIDETGTLHRHEVGPEEYFTPEGKTETFSNDKLLTEESLTNLRPSPAAAVDPATRQILSPPGAAAPPVAFVAPPPLPQGSPRRFYLMRYGKPPDATLRDKAPNNAANQIPGLQRVLINRLPFPDHLQNLANNPVPFQLPYPPTINNNPVAFPIPIVSPPKIQNVPYPVPVPVQTPPQIQIQKVPFAVPQPVPVPVQTPPVIRIQKVPVPVPQPIPIPQPVPYPHVPMMRAYFRPGPVIPMPVGQSECDTSPCRNGGTCYSVNDLQSYRCHCSSGFKGIHCEDTSKCHPNPCENFGECTVLQSGYECSCRRGFRGTRCEVRDKCHPSPCRNGGSCTSVGKEYACSCIVGFIGQNCEVESKCFPLNPCKHGGVCHEDDTSYKCTCATGWTGISCEIPDPCARNPCYNGGVCRGLGTSYTCSCPVGYLGKTCQIESQCHPGNPCHNGGTCHEHNLNGYRCYCNRKWTGSHCEIPSHVSYY